jgi:hypothetical protein
MLTVTGYARFLEDCRLFGHYSIESESMSAKSPFDLFARHKNN